jgi:hypothetical protein
MMVVVVVNLSQNTVDGPSANYCAIINQWFIVRSLYSRSLSAPRL